MKATAEMVKVINDKMKVCWWDRRTQKVYCQRKRTKFVSVAAKTVQREYVRSIVWAIRYIRAEFKLPLRDCTNVVNYLRGHAYFEASYLAKFN